MRWILFITTCVALLSISIHSAVFTQGTYEDYYGDSSEQVRANVMLVLDYLQGNAKQLPDTVYTVREQIHMQDVRGLFVILHWLFVSSTLLTLFLAYRTPGAFETLAYSAITVLFFLLIISFLLVINFAGVFLFLHEMTFDNDYWLLPSNTTLIQLFPQSFFEWMSVEIMKRLLFLTVVLIGSYFFKKQLDNILE